MVNMIGFYQKQPFERIGPPAEPHEPGWYLRIKPRPTLEQPLRAKVVFPTGKAYFDSPEDARKYLAHPGHVPLAARAYLEHFGEETS